MEPKTRPETALTYPGQGGYTPGLLARLEHAFPEGRAELSRIRSAWLAETDEDLDEVLRDRERDIDAIASASLGQVPTAARVSIAGGHPSGYAVQLQMTESVPDDRNCPGVTGLRHRYLGPRGPRPAGRDRR